MRFKQVRPGNKERYGFYGARKPGKSNTNLCKIDELKLLNITLRAAYDIISRLTNYFEMFN